MPAARVSERFEVSNTAGFSSRRVLNRPPGCWSNSSHSRVAVSTSYPTSTTEIMAECRSNQRRCPCSRARRDDAVHARVRERCTRRLGRCDGSHRGDVTTAAVHRHGDRIDDEIGLAVRRHRPADDKPDEHVGHAREIQPPLDSWDIRHVRDPQLVGPTCCELAVDPVRCDVRGRVLSGDRRRRFRRWQPTMSAWRINRDTRFRPTRTPVSVSSAWIRAAP